MRKYIISYDLNKSGKDYEGLFEAIKSTSNGIWCNPCKSTWLIQSLLQSSKEVYDALKSALDADDYIIITEFSNNAFGFLDDKTVEYMNKFFIQ